MRSYSRMLMFYSLILFIAYKKILFGNWVGTRWRKEGVSWMSTSRIKTGTWVHFGIQWLQKGVANATVLELDCQPTFFRFALNIWVCSKFVRFLVGQLTQYEHFLGFHLRTTVCDYCRCLWPGERYELIGLWDLTLYTLDKTRFMPLSDGSLSQNFFRHQLVYFCL